MSKQARKHLPTASWQGPLPPPAALEHFNVIVENGAERIFKMAEAEQKARLERELLAMQYEHQKLDAMRADTKRGQWLGFSLAISAIIAATVTAYLEVDWRISCALVGVPILGAIKAIVSGRKV